MTGAKILVSCIAGVAWILMFSVLVLYSNSILALIWSGFFLSLLCSTSCGESISLYYFCKWPVLSPEGGGGLYTVPLPSSALFSPVLATVSCALDSCKGPTHLSSPSFFWEMQLYHSGSSKTAGLNSVPQRNNLYPSDIFVKFQQCFKRDLAFIDSSC